MCLWNIKLYFSQKLQNQIMLRLVRDLKDQLVPASVMSSDPCHQTRLFKALSNLCLKTSRDLASTAFIGDVFQCLTTLTTKNSFLLSKLSCPSLRVCTLVLVLSLQSWWRVSLQLPCRAPSDTGILLWGLHKIFSRVNSPKFLSLFL